MSRRKNAREGAVLVFVGILLIVLLGMVALAVDLGWIYFTKAQLQSSSDSGSLAGATELLAGLGAGKTSEPAEVVSAAGLRAVEYVALHRAGEAGSTFIDANRDVRLGKATLDPDTKTWSFEWGVQPYNAVGVTTRRSDVGVNPGDRKLPLFFAPVLGTDFSNVTAESVAVIMPATTIRVPPGSGVKGGLAPFAYEEARWDKYLRAKDYYENTLGRDPSLINVDIIDPAADGGDDSPLFFEMVKKGQKLIPRQLFDDQYSFVAPDIVENPDGILEANIYPLANEAGNFGTVDIGGNDNSSAVLKRQIEFGISEDDMAGYADNALPMPTHLNGDTGISGGIQAAIEDVLGDARAILLYESVVGTGNTSDYTIVEMVGTRFMDVKLNGGDKILVIQLESVSVGGGVPNYEEGIDDETTIFTPLILAR